MAKKRSIRKMPTKHASKRRSSVSSVSLSVPNHPQGSSAHLVGRYSFIAGVLLALLAGLIPNLEQFPWVAWLLVVLGLVVGLLNISRYEQTAFLVAGLGLLMASTAVTALLPLGIIVANILKNVIAFVAPSVLIVAVIAIANLAHD